MNKPRKTLALAALAAAALAAGSCVPKRQFAELELKTERTFRDRDSLKAANERLTVQNTELQSELDLTRLRLQQALDRQAAQLDSVRHYKGQHDILRALANDLTARLDQMTTGAENENRQMLGELHQLREELQAREENLKNLKDSLGAERNNLEMMQVRMEDRNQLLAALDSTLRQKEADIDAQGRQLAELRSLLAQKDKAVQELREQVAAALTGFGADGLKVEQKEGRVYVGIDEKLLFKSGRYTIDGKGRGVLVKLSEVLAQSEGVDILVEGHTDDVPLAGRGDIQDNWDLSAKRATTVAKVLLENKNLDPRRIIAAGRSEYHPVEAAKTAEARAKNRRTEIILTPNIDELMRILGGAQPAPAEAGDGAGEPQPEAPQGE